MGGLPGPSLQSHYKEDSLYGGSLYRGNTVYPNILHVLHINFIFFYIKNLIIISCSEKQIIIIEVINEGI
jgi:hypothetical protein